MEPFSIYLVIGRLQSSLAEMGMIVEVVKIFPGILTKISTVSFQISVQTIRKSFQNPFFEYLNAILIQIFYEHFNYENEFNVFVFR